VWLALALGQALTACLAGKYTVFGKVISGMEVLDAMEKVRTQACAWRRPQPCRATHVPPLARQTPCDASDVPVNEMRVLRVTIHANPLAQ
jgi:cyclophilin family peptidyl-prolyl cis-trans isomerase